MKAVTELFPQWSARACCQVFLTFFLLCGSVSLQARTIQLNGQTYVDLGTVAGWLGMDLREAKADEIARLSSSWSQLEFTRNRRAFSYNGTQVHLGYPVALSRGELFISKNDYSANIQPLLTPHVFASKAPRLYRIVIDPGHGGKDPGAENRAVGTNEKEVALAVALRLRKALQGYGYQVLLTREEDRFLSLGERSAFANQVEADLFLSLHLNAEASGRVAGVETFVFTPFNQPSTARSRLHTSDRRVYPGNRNDTWNTLAGYHLQRALKEHTGTRDRGLKRARFAVLRETAVPAVLLELGFISHGPTARLARTARQQQLWTEAIVAGVLDYQGALNQVRGK